MLTLTANQWNLVYNVFSFGLVSMLACTIYTLVSQARVLPKYRNALVMSSMVTFIAGYHYWRIFNSFSESSEGMVVKVSGHLHRRSGGGAGAWRQLAAGHGLCQRCSGFVGDVAGCDWRHAGFASGTRLDGARERLKIAVSRPQAAGRMADLGLKALQTSGRVSR